MIQRDFKISFLVLAAIVIAVPFLILAQDVGPIVIGQRIKLHSQTLREDFVLRIYTPDTARASTERYPVMYLLDGDFFFTFTTGIVQFLSGVGRMPRMIVVGIESSDRIRDFTPADSSVPGSGGADTFLQFLSDELLPYVDSHYATAPLRMLVGHSVGGSFVLNTLLTHPQKINAYFMLSSNLWLGKDTLVNRLESFLKNSPTLSAFVYETHTTQESAKNQAATTRLWNLIDTYRVDGLQWKLKFMPDESHNSIVLRSIYDGLESFFSPWELRGDLSVIGMLGFQQHYRQLSDRYGYTINPREGRVNDLGYLFLNQGKVEEAIKIFKWNVQLYPKSANVYDSLGEAYAKKGDTKLAIENYEKSVALDPNNTAGIEILKKLKAK